MRYKIIFCGFSFVKLINQFISIGIDFKINRIILFSQNKKKCAERHAVYLGQRERSVAAHRRWQQGLQTRGERRVWRVTQAQT